MWSRFCVSSGPPRGGGQHGPPVGRQSSWKSRIEVIANIEMGNAKQFINPSKM